MGHEAHAGSEPAPRHEGRSGVRGFISDAWAAFTLARRFREERGYSFSNFTSPSSDLLNALMGGPSKSGARVSEDTAFNVSAVRACVNFRANLIAMLPLKVYKKTPRGPEEQRDHPLARLLRGRVSPSQTSFKWRHATQVCFDLGGNGYSRITRNTYAEPERIQFTLPAKVTPLYSERTGEVGFRLANEPNALMQHEVLHIANLSTNGITGRSPLADLRDTVGLALTAEEYAGRSFVNGNRKPGVFEGGASMSATKAKEFLDFFTANYSGVANAGKSPLLFGGMTWKDAGFSNADAELLESRRFSIEEIARAYQIPLHLIGSTDKATTWGSGIEQLNQGLVDYMLGPLCENWEAEMETTLLTEKEQADGFYVKFSVDALLRGSPKTRADVYQIMRGIGAMDINQIRNLEEWETYPDAWAGDPRQPLNNQGGGQGVSEPAAATTGDNAA